MDLTVLGAGPAYTDRPGAIGAAYLLRHGDAALLLDMGQGSFPSLANEIEPSRLDAVAVSHLHPDHFIDLVALRHYLRYEFAPPRRVRVLGPAHLLQRLDALHDEAGFAEAVFDLIPTGGASTHAVGPFTIEATPVLHMNESYAYRVCAGDPSAPGLVYSGDCGRASDLEPLLRPGDTLLSEVSFGPRPVPPGANHLNAQAVGPLAARTGVGRLLLTHIQMGFDRDETTRIVRDLSGVPVQMVDPGERFEV